MIQIDMDMPSECLYCPMIHCFVRFSSIRWYCGFNRKELSNIFERPKSCPLIEVKDGD